MSLIPPYLTRVEVDADEERDDGLLYGAVRGRAGERRVGVLHAQQHGLASRPPKGSVGVKLAMGGRHAQPIMFGAEHPSMRPRMQPGETVLYNAYGEAVSIVQNNIRIVSGGTITIKAATIVLDGDCRIGGADASRPASAQGTIDTGGDVEVSNFATRVWLK